MSQPIRILLPVLLLSLAATLPACGPAEGAPTCTDGVENGTETDVDCGGTCGACLDGRRCAQAADCMSGACVSGQCGDACADGVRTGDEADVDCGGSCSARCPIDATCGSASDCASGLCQDGRCSTAPTCSDRAKNGDETDLDCGGSCPPCDDQMTCEESGDCESVNCDQGVCKPAASCTDQLQNGTESDINCGGDRCPPCSDGRTCGAPSDCRSGLCTDGLCDPGVTDTCSNQVQDGDETDLDCGGSCGACPDGYRCLTDDDCPPTMFGNACAEGICGGFWVCDDYEQNGHETDVDCGGGVCRGCQGSLACEANEDCLSGECVDGVCTDPPYTCDNGVVDGLETDIDCGGGVCPACGTGFYCLNSFDCELWDCVDGVCGDSCRDSMQNGRESDVDCGGAICQPCRGGQLCGDPSDCGSGVCTENVCEMYAPTCGNEALDGTETDLDCGGTGCVPCAIGRTCQVGADCESGSCSAGICMDTLFRVQSSAESVSCAASGEIVVQTGIALAELTVVTPRLDWDDARDAYWIQHAGYTWADGEGRNSGALLLVDKSLGVTVNEGQAVSLTGNHVEIDCQTAIHVGAGGQLAASGRGLTAFGYPLSAPFESGGSAAAEPFEGVLVQLTNMPITEVGGYAGPESPGNPKWWFKVGNGIYVANDFGITDFTPSTDITVGRLTGVLKYAHGVYLLVPRSAVDLSLQP